MALRLPVKAEKDRRSSSHVLYDRLRVVERVSYVLIFTPVLTNYLANGKLPADPRHLITEVVVGTMIFGFILILRRSLKEIEMLDRLRQTLTRSIIHDLKNPLTSIMTSLSCVLGNLAGPEKKQKLLEIAMEGCRSEMRMIEMLLDVDRLEMQVLTPRKERLEAQALIQECIREVTPVASHAEVRLRSFCEGRLPDLRADADLLKRVFLNLLLNAIKYTPRGGDVSVHGGYSMEEGAFFFLVQDTGRGIGKEHLGNLFEKFYRVEGNDQHRYRGTGLGLYFCRLVVEAHGGSIEVESELGRGTTVIIRIPQGLALGDRIATDRGGSHREGGQEDGSRTSKEAEIP